MKSCIGVAEHARTTTAEVALLVVGDHFTEETMAGGRRRLDCYLKLFPKSQRAVYGELQAARPCARRIAGALWDDTSLVEAQQRYRKILRDHPAASQGANVEAILENDSSSPGPRSNTRWGVLSPTHKTDAAIRYFRIVTDEYSDGMGQKAELELTKLGAGQDGRRSRQPPGQPEEAKP